MRSFRRPGDGLEILSGYFEYWGGHLEYLRGHFEYLSGHSDHRAVVLSRWAVILSIQTVIQTTLRWFQGNTESWPSNHRQVVHMTAYILK